MKKLNIKFIFFVLLVLLPVAAFAIEGVTGEKLSYKLLAAFDEKKEVSSLEDYLTIAIPFVMRLAAFLAVVMLVIGGFEYALSETVTNKNEAKEHMFAALQGLGLALVSYLILFTISPSLVSLKLPLPDPGTQQFTDTFYDVVYCDELPTTVMPEGVCRTDLDGQQCFQNGGISYKSSKTENCPSSIACSSYLPDNKNNCPSKGPGLYWELEVCENHSYSFVDLTPYGAGIPKMLANAIGCPAGIGMSVKALGSQQECLTEGAKTGQPAGETTWQCNSLIR